MGKYEARWTAWTAAYKVMGGSLASEGMAVRRVVLGAVLLASLSPTALGVCFFRSAVMPALMQVGVTQEIVVWGRQCFDNNSYSAMGYNAISAGEGHSLALKRDGTIVGWGMNRDDQANPPAGNDYIAIAAGYSHSLALKTDGTIVGWGDSRYGATIPPAGNDYVAIAGGGCHSLALKTDGTIVGWGYDHYGEWSSPSGNDFVAIASGGSHSLALKADGTIVGWGSNDYGETSPPAGNDYIAIAAGSWHSLALKTDGTIVGWGMNFGGQANSPVGNDYIAIAAGGYHSLALKNDGTIVGWGNSDSRQSNPPSGNDYIAIAAGGSHSLALKTDGTIVGWGNNDSGQANPPLGNDYIAIAAGGSQSLALKTNGSIVGWGWNLYGESSPPAGNDYIAMAAGYHHSLALTTDGMIVGWGSNYTVDRDGWEYCGQANPPSGNDYIAIAAGGYHSLALKTDGTIVGWGNNDSGQANPPSGNEYTAIAAGYYYSLALRANGTIVGWGDNWFGQSSPPAGDDFVAIAAGDDHSLALKADGTIVGWGYDHYGVWSPPAGDDFVVIAAGRSHSLALKRNGSIVSWGDNEFGQSSSPTGNDYIAIAAGQDHSLALRRVPPPIGWTTISAPQPVSGLVLYGDKMRNTREMAGLPATMTAKKTQCLGHFVSNKRWYTGVVVANPNASSASVALTAYGDDGIMIGSPLVRTLPANGKVSEEVSKLFSGEVTGTGWIKVKSDVPVIASELCGDQISGGVMGFTSCELGTQIVLPHFVHSERWWTHVTVVNPGNATVTVTLKAFQRDGTAIQSKNFSIGPRQKLSGAVECLLPLTANKTGWILVESTGGNVGGLLAYGDTQGMTNRIAGVTGMKGSMSLNFSGFFSDSEWWTGLALVNPGSTGANVTLRAYRSSGDMIDTKIQNIGPLCSSVGLVKDMFQLGTDTQGWVEVTSDVPVVGMEMLNADDPTEQAWGLAAIEGQYAGTILFMPHYAISGRWWTLFGFANPDDSVAATVNLTAYENDGTLAGTASKTIPANGNLVNWVRNVFGF